MMLKLASLVLAGILCLAVCSAPSEPTQAAIRGRFLLRGDVPDAVPLTVDKDRECCGREALVNEELVVNPDRGVANVVVYIRSKNIPSAHQDDLGSLRISTKGCRYEPHVAVAQIDQKLVIEADGCVTINPNLAHVPMGMLIPTKGEAFLRLSSATNVPSQLTCTIHPWMKAWVLVRPNPYACVSSLSGEFEIPSVPHGVWELQFWHEKLGYIEEMSIGGAVKKLPKGCMQIEVGPGGVDFGTIALEF
jgi:hypothetical protein